MDRQHEQDRAVGSHARDAANMSERMVKLYSEDGMYDPETLSIDQIANRRQNLLRLRAELVGAIFIFILGMIVGMKMRR